ncbi:MAG: HPr(Ser) kinase/phosphatase [Halanaerobiaceae bacterium]
MAKKSVSPEQIKEKFNLEVLAGEETLMEKEVEVSDIKRPGLELAGFWEHFVPERLQVLGMTEISFLRELATEVLEKRVEKFLSYDLRCIIVSRNLEIPEPLIRESRNESIPLMRTATSTTRFISKVTSFLEKRLAPEKEVHGVLVDIYGIGVLILGESGIGKSETAIELVKRGHRLVADDVISVRKIGEEELVGRAPHDTRYFLELRGIGIINVRSLFGAGAVKYQSRIDMIVELEMWDEDKTYERLGIDGRETKFLGIRVPEIIIPVKRGRNLAMVLEVAAMNFRLKSMGYNAARDFVEKTRK